MPDCLPPCGLSNLPLVVETRQSCYCCHRTSLAISDSTPPSHTSACPFASLPASLIPANEFHQSRYTRCWSCGRERIIAHHPGSQYTVRCSRRPGRMQPGGCGYDVQGSENVRFWKHHLLYPWWEKDLLKGHEVNEIWRGGIPWDVRVETRVKAWKKIINSGETYGMPAIRWQILMRVDKVWRRLMMEKMMEVAEAGE